MELHGEECGDARGAVRVLVVDDERELRQLLGRGLSRAGYDVCFAGDGGDALTQLSGGADIDAVVTDIAMPVVTGCELATEILASHPGVPVLFVSGDPGPARLLRHPLVDSLRTPASMAEVRRLVQKLLATPGALARRRRREGSSVQNPGPVEPVG